MAWFILSITHSKIEFWNAIKFAMHNKIRILKFARYDRCAHKRCAPAVIPIPPNEPYAYAKTIIEFVFNLRNKLGDRFEYEMTEK